MSLKSLFWKKVELRKQGCPPKIEPGQQLTYLQDKNKYLFFGGLNQKEQNTEQAQKISRKESDSETNRSQQKSQRSDNINKNKINFQIKNNNKLNFSLQGRETKDNNNIQDFIYILDPAEYIWTEHKCTGKIPTKRINFFSWYEAPYFLIYGGETTGGKILNDMYVLNLDDFEWKRFFWLQGPPPRIDCQLVNMGVNKYIIGGAGMPENWLYDDIWMFNFENVLWNQNSSEIPGIYWEKIQLQNENLFEPLKAFGAVKVSETQIFIFGGYNQKKQCTDTSILLDIDEQCIQQFDTRGIKPGPRAYHKILPVKENIICLFGGVSCPEDSMKGTTSIMLNDFYVLSLKEGYWTRPTTGGYLPSSRYSFSMAGNQSEMASEILLLGGRSTESSCDKYLYVLGEMLKDQEEYWGETNNQSKLQFAGYREALKQNKKKQEELKTVSLQTLEFSQAEKVISEQKREIGQLETLSKQLKEKNKQIQDDQQKFEENINENRKKLDIKCQETQKQIEVKQQKNSELKDFLGQIQTLLAYERKKRKLLQLKSFQLQDCLRKAENQIITIDQVYNKGYKDDLIEGVLTEEALRKLEKKKQDHKQQLVLFREDFENIYQNEKKIRAEIKDRKELLKPDINVSKDWKKFLSPEEKRIFESKGSSSHSTQQQQKK